MADKDKKLVEGLRDAKKRKMYFAIVPNGTDDGKLFVRKKRVPKAEIDEAKKALKAKIAWTGKCSWGDNLVLEVVKDPGGNVGKAVKAVAKRDADATVKPEFVVAEDADEDLPPMQDDDTEDTEEQTDGQQSAKGPSEVSSGPAMEGPKVEGPKAPSAKDEVTKRLNDMLNPFKEAVSQNYVDEGKMQLLMNSVTEAIKKKDYAKAKDGLGKLDPFIAKFKLHQKAQYDQVVAKNKEVNQKIAELEKNPNSKVIAALIKENKDKSASALTNAGPPDNRVAQALNSLGGVAAACGRMDEMLVDYARVLKTKADTDKKIDRLEKHKQKALITAEIATAKADVTKAMAKAGPPDYEFLDAIKALGAVDKGTAKAEVKILDELVKGKSRDQMAKALKDLFKERFGVNLKMTASTDTQAEELASMKRIYELMAQVPESAATNNPSFKKLTRIGGESDTSFYQSEKTILGFIKVKEKKIVLNCTRPRTDGTELQSGLKSDGAGGFDPPLDPNCAPKDGVSSTQSYFDWTTLHEIAHAIDDQKNFMNTNGSNADYGGWTDYGSDVSKAAAAAAAHFKFNTKEAIDYITAMLKGAQGSRPTKKPAADGDPGAWATKQADVEAWCDSVREAADPWDNMPTALGGTVIYHEAYGNSWVSYLKAARSKGISGYQFRAPGEWFSEMYAAYHSGVLKDSHPMIKKFLLDL